MPDINDNTPVSSDVQPVLPSAHMRGRFAGPTKRTLRKAKPSKKPPRERPPLHTQTPEVLERILPLGEEIKWLVALQEANGGILPYGELTRAAVRLAPYKHELLRLRKSSSDEGSAEEEDEEAIKRGSEEESKPMHKNGVSFLMNQFIAYHAKYQDREPAEAFSPFHKKGRPRGRTLPTEVTDFMKGLWKKRGFQSRNHDGTAAEVDYILFAREIFSITKQTYPDYADIITLADVYHAYEDLEKDDAAGLAYARQGLSAIRSNLPFQNSNIEGIHEQWQSDIRPLPIYVRWGEIICTVRILYIIDQRSKVILGWKLVPGKDENLKKLVVNRDFTAQEFRALLVWTMRRWQIRMRQLYVDNGAQYKAEVMAPFVRLLTVAGEKETKFSHTPHGDPKGRGTAERHLGDIDNYLRTRPAFYDEHDPDGEFGYRAVLKRIKEGEVLPRTLEDLALDLKEHIDIVNSESENGSSRLDILNQGTNYGLTMPSKDQLFFFARQKDNKPVKVQPYGIWYLRQQWEPENIEDPVLREQWLQAALSPADRQMISATLDDELLVYVNLTGDGVHYEPFVKKGAPRLSVVAQKKASRATEKSVIRGHRTANEEVDALMLERIGQPLILDGSRKRLAPPVKQESTPAEGAEAPPPGNAAADWARPGDRGNQDPPNQPPSGDQPPANTPQSAPADEDDDWSFFTGFKSGQS